MSKQTGPQWSIRPVIKNSSKTCTSAISINSASCLTSKRTAVRPQQLSQKCLTSKSTAVRSQQLSQKVCGAASVNRNLITKVRICLSFLHWSEHATQSSKKREIQWEKKKTSYRHWDLLYCYVHIVSFNVEIYSTFMYIEFLFTLTSTLLFCTHHFFFTSIHEAWSQEETVAGNKHTPRQTLLPSRRSTQENTAMTLFAHRLTSGRKCYKALSRQSRISCNNDKQIPTSMHTHCFILHRLTLFFLPLVPLVSLWVHQVHLNM